MSMRVHASYRGELHFFLLNWTQNSRKTSTHAARQKNSRCNHFCHRNGNTCCIRSVCSILLIYAGKEIRPPYGAPNLQVIHQHQRLSLILTNAGSNICRFLAPTTGAMMRSDLRWDVIIEPVRCKHILACERLLLLNWNHAMPINSLMNQVAQATHSMFKRRWMLFRAWNLLRKKFQMLNSIQRLHQNLHL